MSPFDKSLVPPPDKSLAHRIVARQVLPRTARIPKRTEISRLQRLGTKLHTKGYIIAYQRSVGASSRIAVTVSKKVDKRAVVRNRIKRRLKEVFRILRPDLVHNLDIVIIAKKEAKDYSLQDNFQQIIKALVAKRLLKPPSQDSVLTQNRLSKKSSNTTSPSAITEKTR